MNFPTITPQYSLNEWLEILQRAEILPNPEDWFQQVLKENGFKVLEYEEFNIDDWD